uniref:IncF plasmid conjugative transfer pilus assembly protein TraC n=1 Tax=Klebsiella pneumoniae TaxID=573 RepID=A0A8B0SP02_KLEPN|nr:IncF plasmid conjugative transfer pilus assembly protein TraC [Klebsiella pneumoniae]
MTGSKNHFSPFLLSTSVYNSHIKKKIQKEYLRYKAITDNQSKKYLLFLKISSSPCRYGQGLLGID